MTALKLILPTAFALAFAANANSSVYIPSLKVKSIQVMDNATGDTKTKHYVDDIEITLSKKDKVRAKNWNLTESEWAKYKYAIEYMPRGQWTPNLPAPIVLGNLAKTEQERLHYARVMNNIERDRRDRELRFQLTGIAQLGEFDPTLHPDYVKPKVGLARMLPENLTKLRSIFIDMEHCEVECKKYVTLKIASTSNITKLDIHATNSSTHEVKQMLLGMGIDENRMARKNITINAKLVNKEVLKHNEGRTEPFVMMRDDDGTTKQFMTR
jgi:integrating conjugative element protein (TIGR03759 family)